MEKEEIKDLVVIENKSQEVESKTNQDIKNYKSEAEIFVVKTDSDYTEGEKRVISIRKARKLVEEEMKYLISPAKETIKRIQDRIKPAIEELKHLEDNYADKTGKYLFDKKEQERKLQEKARKEEEERREKIEREEREKREEEEAKQRAEEERILNDKRKKEETKAEELRKLEEEKEKERAKAEQERIAKEKDIEKTRLQQELNAKQQGTIIKDQATSGSGYTKKVRSIVSIDKMTILKQVLNGTLPDKLISIDKRELNRIVITGQRNILGVHVEEKEKVIFRTNK